MLVDGCCLLRARIRAFFHTTVYLEVTGEERLRRFTSRQVAGPGSMEAVVESFRKRCLPGFDLYLAREDPIAHADVVLDNNDVSAPFVVGSRFDLRQGVADA